MWHAVMDGGWPPQWNCVLHFCVRENSNVVSSHGKVRQWTLRVVFQFRDCVQLSQYISSSCPPAGMALMPPGLADDHTGTYVRPNNDFSELHDVAPKRKASASPLSEALQGPAEKKLKQSNGADGRGAFGRDDRCIYGNPKDIIKPSPPSDAFDSSSVLDLSCKAKEEDKVAKPSDVSDVTYQNYPRNNHPYLPDAFPRSNLEIKLVNSPKRPSTTEQLQIAKLQQQQRRSVQQQQKMLQQMRRTLDAGGSSSSGSGRSSTKPSELPKDETHPTHPTHTPHPSLGPPPPAFAHPPPYMDTQTKELPDGHPVLPLLDPVYFSALYNAHGFLPPSSPSIAAAFIGTLQDALPKLSIMFPPPTSSAAGSSLLHQKSGDNLN